MANRFVTFCNQKVTKEFWGSQTCLPVGRFALTLIGHFRAHHDAQLPPPNPRGATCHVRFGQLSYLILTKKRLPFWTTSPDLTWWFMSVTTA